MVYKASAYQSELNSVLATPLFASEASKFLFRPQARLYQKGHINTRIQRLVLRPKTGGIRETMVCRILLFRYHIYHILHHIFYHVPYTTFCRILMFTWLFWGAIVSGSLCLCGCWAPTYYPGATVTLTRTC